MSVPAIETRISGSRDLSFEDASHVLQQLVAYVVPELIVGLLEIIEIQEEHRRRHRVPLGEFELVGQPVPKHNAVGQLGQRVGLGDPRGFLVRSFPSVCSASSISRLT